MNSVMISIQPKYVIKIASGEKTIDVRKTVPNIEPPFRGFIYCTDKKKSDNEWQFRPNLYLDINKKIRWIDVAFESIICCEYLQQKVVGEFICKHISKLIPVSTSIEGVKYYLGLSDIGLKKTCLSQKQLCEYGKGKNLYGWHISDLKIYDKPKEIREFQKPCYLDEETCYICQHTWGFDYNKGCDGTITRPPQSWCYVDEI